MTEGMADAFATQAFPAAPAHPWAEALTPQQLRKLWARAQPSLDEPWTFVGTGSGSQARAPSRLDGLLDRIWDRLELLGQAERASDLVTVPAKEVPQGSGWMATTGPPTTT